MNKVNVKKLDFIIGKIIRKIHIDDAKKEITFIFSDGFYIKFFNKNKSEDVYVEDVCGDINDLLNTPLLVAESSKKECDEFEGTWTFYIFSTIKGTINIRWVDISNDYYSEEVNWCYSGF